ncbi:type II toxin-antitoxin system Rv0910 family toxin [Nocardioides stalactiti]|uniref:type II toxin-antitoxin system Rv0910 family toxin n=1 Tax=Nocardioides stalactiti TaxID=2755356 RepID=UPI0015FF4EF9|nr:SRPBCC family protein [Nocardioides stalactiti]
MGQLTATRDFSASAEDVWTLASDPNNFEKWLTLHQKWKGDIPAELAVGTQMTEVISMMGMPNTITWTVDEYDAPSTLAISGTGMAGVQVAISLAATPTDSGSRFDLSCSFEGQMIVGALGKAIEKQGAAELESSLDNFAALLG